MGSNTPARIALSALFLLVAGTTPHVLHAAENETVAAEEATFDALYTAMTAAADEATMIDNQIETLKQTFASQSPGASAMESARPGLLDAFGNALRPWVFEHSHRLQALYRPRFVAILKQELSLAEAQRLSAFYTSPVGRKLLENMSQNYTGANVLGDLENLEQRVDTERVGRDVDSAAVKGLSAMSTEDLASEDAAVLRDADLMAKMEQVSSRFVELRAEMENAPLDEDLGKAMEESVMAAVSAHLAGDPSQSSD